MLGCLVTALCIGTVYVRVKIWIAHCNIKQPHTVFVELFYKQIGLGRVEIKTSVGLYAKAVRIRKTVVNVKS